MAVDAKSASRTASFFRLAVEDAAGVKSKMANQKWQDVLGKVQGLKVKDRTYEGPTRKLIGEVLVVDGALVLKLMEPRDENSWLEILKADAAATPVDAKTIGTLVETTIVVFLPKKNIFGMIKGSTSSPSHSAVAEWIDHLQVNGKRLMKDGLLVVAEPALSQEARKQLNSSDGVAVASVRINTGKAQDLEDAGSGLAETIKSLKSTYGDIIVTVTMRVPRGKAHDAARKELRNETLRLQKVAGVAESLSASLVHYDAEAKAHQDEVNFISQRITASTSVPLTGNDGMPIRNESAVRAIIKAATDMRAELDSVI